MNGHRRGGSGPGLKHSSVAALVALGCCLLSAPAANADFDDLLDTVLAAATAGPDPADLAGIPGDLGGFGDFDVHGVLDDPLAQLDQALHGAPGQLGLGEPDSGPADTTHDTGTTPDTTPGATPDAGSGSGSTTGSEHGTSGGSSANSPSLPKFSMPSGGNGGSGGGPGGSGGSSGNGATKTKANAGATKDALAPVATPQPEVP